ncbi:hypothetical protein B0A52_09416 [Exophiala mesophila]|uniref:Uncharacterized protein n=1 Tax=Exophiala mesophila TaxID=212818 RepID=A0A438MUM9_EXOME|nr:hypothetical protein B0A52_09416 [Exophiala mesophila]
MLSLASVSPDTVVVVPSNEVIKLMFRRRTGGTRRRRVGKQEQAMPMLISRVAAKIIMAAAWFRSLLFKNLTTYAMRTAEKTHTLQTVSSSRRLPEDRRMSYTPPREKIAIRAYFWGLGDPSRQSIGNGNRQMMTSVNKFMAPPTYHKGYQARHRPWMLESQNDAIGRHIDSQ